MVFQPRESSPKKRGALKFVREFSLDDDVGEPRGDDRNLARHEAQRSAGNSAKRVHSPGRTIEPEVQIANTRRFDPAKNKTHSKGLLARNQDLTRALA